MSASIWNPGGSIIPQADPNSQIKSEPFTATEGQTAFVLTQFTYTLGVGALSIFRNGVKLVGASDVTEVSNTTFSVSPCDAGDMIEAVGNTAIANPDAILAEILATRDETIIIAAEVDADKVTAQLAADEAAASAASIELPIPVSSGGTGSTDAAGARTALGVPPIASPIFTGLVTSPQYYNVTESYGALQVAGVDVLRFGGDTSGQLAGFRNVLLNGNFEVNQRGGYFTVGGYCFDRWFLYNPVNTAVSRVDIGATYGTKALSIAAASTTNSGSIEQPLENSRCRALAGKKATLSFWASAGAAGGVLTAAVFKNATKDSLNAGAWSQVGTKSVSVVGIQKVTLTVDIPSDGSAEGLMPIVSWSNLTNGSTSYIWNIQFEPGSIDTKYDHRPYELELALCQAYLPYLEFRTNSVLGVGQCVSATGAYVYVKFPVPARVPPTGWVAPVPAAFYVTDSAYNGKLLTSITPNYFDTDGCMIATVGATGLVAGNATILASTGTYGIYFTGCEL